MTSALNSLIRASLLSLATFLSIRSFWILESHQSLCCCGSWQVQPEAMVLVPVRPDGPGATALEWSCLWLSTNDYEQEPCLGPVRPLSVVLALAGPVPMGRRSLRREHTCLGPVRPLAVAPVGSCFRSY